MIDPEKLPDDPDFRRAFENSFKQADEIPARTGKAWIVDLGGEDGNAYVILGTVSRIIKNTLGKEVAEEYHRRATSGDYQNLLAVTREYVEIRDTRTRVLVDIDEENDD